MSQSPSMVKVLSGEELRDKIKTADNLTTVYANHTRVAHSFYDVRIFCGQSSVSPRGEVSIEEGFCVVLTPECAKAFLDTLVTTLNAYETSFGPLRPAPQSHKPSPRKAS